MFPRHTPELCARGSSVRLQEMLLPIAVYLLVLDVVSYGIIAVDECTVTDRTTFVQREIRRLFYPTYKYLCCERTVDARESLPVLRDYTRMIK